MTRLNISLLGQLHIQLDGRTLDDLGYGKVRALLVYLAVEADRVHRREALAALLWPNQPEAEARHGLRQALATLRKAIDGDAPPSLLVSRETIGFNRDSDAWLDVTAFTALLDDCDRHPHQQPAICARCAQRIEDAASLYRGDFLAGITLAASVEFEEWVLLQRQRLQQRLRDALAHLAVYHERHGDYGRARDVLQRQLELDPWLESAHRQLMRVLWLSGDRSAALAQYDRCRQLLADELGVEPEPATTALSAEIRAAPAPIAVPKVAVSERRLPEPLTPFVGRARELEAIAARLSDSRCRLLSLVGPGGIGKTRLAIKAAREHVTAFADGAAFVALAPVSSPELLGPAIADALGIPLSDHQQPQAQLLDRLRQREQLLVLDNFEHLLAGARLISEILAAAPALKIVVTSRERLNLGGEWVFEVSGLGVPTDAGGFEGYDAVELFTQHLRRVRTNTPLSAAERPWVVHICRWVEGMPLALELAAA